MENQHQNKGDNSTEVEIDLEEFAKNAKVHPACDPGTIIIYVFKVNEIIHKTRESVISYHDLIRIAQVDPKEHDLFQVARKDGNLIEDMILEQHLINLAEPESGIERFFTKHKPAKALYHFKMNGIEKSTVEKHLTVRELMTEYAKVDPSTNTLALVVKGGFHEYHDLEQKVSMEGCPEFTTFFNDPTGVS